MIDENVNFQLIRKTLENNASEFKIYSSNDFNKGVKHIIQLITDAYTLYQKGSFSTSVFLAITVVEETGKLHMGLYIQQGTKVKKDPLKNHTTKHKLGASYTVSIGTRLQKAIGQENIKRIFDLIYSGDLMKVRNEALYCDCKNGEFFSPYDRISQRCARELLLFAIEVFDDNLVGYTSYSMNASIYTDKIFDAIAQDSP